MNKAVLLGTTGAIAALAMLGVGYAVATPLVGFEIATFVMLTVALKLFARASWTVTSTWFCVT